MQATGLEGTAARPYPHLRAALKALTERFALRTAAHQMASRYVSKPNFSEPNTVRLEPVLVADYSATVVALLPELVTWQEFRRLAEAVDTTRALKSTFLWDASQAVISGSPDPQWFHFVLAEFLTDYLGAAANVANRWDPATFSALYARFADSLKTNERRIDLWAPLYSCDCAALPDPVALADGCSLEEPTLQVRADLASEEAGVPRGFGSLSFDPAPQRFYIKRTDRVPISQAGPGMEVRQILVLNAAAIRLAVGGEARVLYTNSLPVPGYCRIPARGGRALMSWSPSYGGVPSLLREQDMPVVRRLAENLLEMEQEYRVPIQRFITIPERFRVEDRLIDAVIALESLLLPGVEQELAFRLALRGAWVLAEDAESRAAWHKKLRDLYSLRSKLVHGAHTKTDIAQAATEATEVLRTLLKRLISERIAPANWRERLETTVFG